MRNIIALVAIVTMTLPAHAETLKSGLQPLDVFELEYALDPQVSPDGRRVAYVRHSMDIMSDRAQSRIWIVEGDKHRPISSATSSSSSPRWSPNGDRLLYVSSVDGHGSELFVRWMDTGETAALTNLPASPGNLSWSPNGKRIAFSMFVEAAPPSLAAAPQRPEGAEWAAPVKVIDALPYRADGAGYLDTGYQQLFTVAADGGTPRQLTSGKFNHGGKIAWLRNSSAIIFSANRIDNPLQDPLDSELWQLDIESLAFKALTDRDGPDFAPTLSSDGRTLAYLGFDDRRMSYHNTRVYLLDLDDGTSRVVTEDFDRSIAAVEWDGGSGRLLVQYDDRGARKIARLSRDGRVSDIVSDVGSAGNGRPYTTGGFSVSANGVIAYSRGTATAPADVGLIARNGRVSTLTDLNSDLLAQRQLGTVEEFVWESSVGDYDIQGWLVKPPGFDADEKYPLVLEIHGGPFAAYGPHFSPEIQLYAAAGYVVLYSNPRGSTSYGDAFANEIHHRYPFEDYDDLMSGVDAVLDTGYIDESALFVTGGSGGGVLTSWIVGKTARFAAAVVQKPVINWGSFVLTSDGSAFFTKYWFGALPWDDPQAYWSRSPLSLVGNVTTPTMLITGEEDFRTPMAESEQYYQALKLRGIDTALVRVPERSHNLVARPSHLIAKAANILAWFERYQ